MKLFCLVCLVMNFWVVVVIILVKSECLNRALLLEAMVLFGDKKGSNVNVYFYCENCLDIQVKSIGL